MPKWEKAVKIKIKRKKNYWVLREFVALIHLISYLSVAYTIFPLNLLFPKHFVWNNVYVLWYTATDAVCGGNLQFWFIGPPNGNISLYSTATYLFASNKLFHKQFIVVNSTNQIPKQEKKKEKK